MGPPVPHRVDAGMVADLGRVDPDRLAARGGTTTPRWPAGTGAVPPTSRRSGSRSPPASPNSSSALLIRAPSAAGRRAWLGRWRRPSGRCCGSPGSASPRPRPGDRRSACRHRTGSACGGRAARPRRRRPRPRPPLPGGRPAGLAGPARRRTLAAGCPRIARAGPARARCARGPGAAPPAGRRARRVRRARRPPGRQPGRLAVLYRPGRAARPAPGGRLDPADPPTGTRGNPAGHRRVSPTCGRPTGGICSCWPPDLAGEIGVDEVGAALSALADAPSRPAYEVALAELPAGCRGGPAGRDRRWASAAAGSSTTSPTSTSSSSPTSDDDLARARPWLATRHDPASAGWSPGRWTRRCGRRASAGRWCGPSPATWPTTGAGPAPGSSRRCSRPGRRPATWTLGPAVRSTTLAPLVWPAAERAGGGRRRPGDAPADQDNVPPRSCDREIKRGPGGLRDIEFAVQLLQLVHGRGDESLRVPAARIPALRAAVAGGYVGRADGEALLAATASCAASSTGCSCSGCVAPTPCRRSRARRCAGWPRALGYTADAGPSAVEEFRAEWVTHASEVRRLHAKLFYRPLLEAVARVPADGLRLTPEAARHRLEVLGFADPAGALRHLQALTGGVSPGRPAIQRTLLPVLLERVRRRAGAGPRAARLPAGLRHARQHPLVSAAAARRGPGRPRLARLLASSGTWPTCWPGAGGAAAARRRRRAAAAAGRELRTSCRGLRRRGGPARRPGRRRPARSGRCAAGSWSGSPAPTCSPGCVDRRPRSARRSPTCAAGHASTRGARRRRRARSRGPAGGAAGPARADRHGPARRRGDRLSLRRRRALRLRPAGRAPTRARPARPRTRSPRSCAGCSALPAPDPPLGVDADLRPEGRQGPLVRSLAAYARYYARWSKVVGGAGAAAARSVWRATPTLGPAFVALADPVRYPADGLTRSRRRRSAGSRRGWTTERLPRGADPATHTKLGRGGLADVEWAVQLLQLRHAGRLPGAAHAPVPSTRCAAARDAGLVAADDAAALARPGGLGGPGPQRGDAGPRPGRRTSCPGGADLAGVVRLLGYRRADPGEFLDDYLRHPPRPRGGRTRLLRLNPVPTPPPQSSASAHRRARPAGWCVPWVGWAWQAVALCGPGR